MVPTITESVRSEVGQSRRGGVEYKVEVGSELLGFV